MRRVWGHSSQRRRWTGFFIFVGTSYGSSVKASLKGSWNLRWLLYQIGDEHCQWRIFDNIQREILEEVFRLCMVIDFNVYYLVSGNSNHDLSYERLYIQTNRRLSVLRASKMEVSGIVTTFSSTIVSLQRPMVVFWSTCKTDSIIHCILACVVSHLQFQLETRLLHLSPV